MGSNPNPVSILVVLKPNLIYIKSCLYQHWINLLLLIIISFEASISYVCRPYCPQVISQQTTVLNYSALLIINTVFNLGGLLLSIIMKTLITDWCV